MVVSTVKARVSIARRDVSTVSVGVSTVKSQVHVYPMFEAHVVGEKSCLKL